MQQNISILDEEKPIIEEVSTVTQSAVAGSCGALININPPSVSDNCGNPVAIGVREDGLELSDSYPVGITAITWSAKDASGNGATLVMQTVRVTDDQKPTIIGLPGAIAISTDPGLCGSKVSWTAPTVTDNCEGSFLAQT
ncbi:HYR domain-containing protein, partial [Rhodonellum psychrophilum]